MNHSLAMNDTFLPESYGENDCDGLPEGFTYFYIAVRVLEGLLAIISNSLTIGAVVTQQSLRIGNTNILIAFLAGFDLVSGFVPPFVLLKHIYHQRKYAHIWKWVYFFDSLINTLSSNGNVTFIVLISLDRFIYISAPLRYVSLVTRSRMVGAICLDMIYCVTSVPIVLGYYFRFDKLIPCVDEQGLPASVVLYALWVPFLGFTLTTVVLYIGIACIAVRQARAVGNIEAMAGRFRLEASRRQNNAGNKQQTGSDDNQKSSHRNQTEKIKKDHKVTKMMSLVVGVYFAVYFPHVIISLLTSKKSPMWLRITERVCVT